MPRLLLILKSVRKNEAALSDRSTLTIATKFGLQGQLFDPLFVPVRLDFGGRQSPLSGNVPPTLSGYVTRRHKETRALILSFWSYASDVRRWS